MGSCSGGTPVVPRARGLQRPPPLGPFGRVPSWSGAVATALGPVQGAQAAVKGTSSLPSLRCSGLSRLLLPPPPPGSCPPPIPAPLPGEGVPLAAGLPAPATMEERPPPGGHSYRLSVVAACPLDGCVHLCAWAGRQRSSTRKHSATALYVLVWAGRHHQAFRPRSPHMHLSHSTAPMCVPPSSSSGQAA